MKKLLFKKFNMSPSSNAFSKKKNGKKKNRLKKYKNRENQKQKQSYMKPTNAKNDLLEIEKQMRSESKTNSRIGKMKFVYPRDPATNKSCAFSFKKPTNENFLEDGNEISFQPQSKPDASKVKNSESLDAILLGIAGIANGDCPAKHSTKKVHESLHKRVERKLSGVSVEDAMKDKTGCRPRANSTDGELNLPRRGLCDEGMVLQFHKWSSNWRQITPKGFVNLGNTCFLNATLQCLAYLPPLCQSVSYLDFCSGRSSNGQRIIRNLRQLFRQVHDLDTKFSNHRGEVAIAPRNIVKLVPMLGNIGSRNGYKFRPGRQEDAHEFLVHLLDVMQDGELRAAGINQHSRGWRDSLPIPRLDETTVVHRIFGGYFRSQVQCTKCGYQSNTYDPFWDLSLEVSKKSSTSIASAFKEFSRKETLDKNNQWRCSGCRKAVCAIKQLTVFRPPLALCIQLKRFAFSGGFGHGNFTGYTKGMRFGGFGEGSKISKSIEFPARLRLPLSDGRKCEYALTGIVVHLGTSATSGHYTSFVKKPGNDESDRWYHMDDSYVESVSEKTVLKQKDVYLLFYCRIEVKLELPSPPCRPSMTTEEAKKFNVLRARNRSRSFLSSHEASKKNTFTIPSVKTPSEATLGNIPEHATGKVNNISNIYQSSDYVSPLNINPDYVSKNNINKERKAVSHEVLSPLSKKNPKQKFIEKNPFNSVKINKDIDKMEKDISLSECDKPKAKVVIDRGASHGKLEVMIGPRFKLKKSWKPKTTFSRIRSEKLELLGTQSVSKWEDDQIDISNSEAQNRSALVLDMNKQNKIQKKRMHLDRWDSLLDQGKKKKVKLQRKEVSEIDNSIKANPFHRIQLGIQKMNSEKAKGFKRAVKDVINSNRSKFISNKTRNL